MANITADISGANIQDIMDAIDDLGAHRDILDTPRPSPHFKDPAYDSGHPYSNETYTGRCQPYDDMDETEDDNDSTDDEDGVITINVPTTIGTSYGTQEGMEMPHNDIQTQPSPTTKCKEWIRNNQDQSSDWPCDAAANNMPNTQIRQSIGDRRQRPYSHQGDHHIVALNEARKATNGLEKEITIDECGIRQPYLGSSYGRRANASDYMECRQCRNNPKEAISPATHLKAQVRTCLILSHETIDTPESRVLDVFEHYNEHDNGNMKVHEIQKFGRPANWRNQTALTQMCLESIKRLKTKFPFDTFDKISVAYKLRPLAISYETADNQTHTILATELSRPALYADAPMPKHNHEYPGQTLGGRQYDTTYNVHVMAVVNPQPAIDTQVLARDKDFVQTLKDLTVENPHTSLVALGRVITAFAKHKNGTYDRVDEPPTYDQCQPVVQLLKDIMDETKDKAQRKMNKNKLSVYDHPQITLPKTHYYRPWTPPMKGFAQSMAERLTRIRERQMHRSATHQWGSTRYMSPPHRINSYPGRWRDDDTYRFRHGSGRRENQERVEEKRDKSPKPTEQHHQPKRKPAEDPKDLRSTMRKRSPHGEKHPSMKSMDKKESTRKSNGNTPTLNGPQKKRPRRQMQAKKE